MKGQLGRAAAAGDAAFAVHDDARQVNVMPGHQRRQAQDGGLRVTPGIGHELGCGDFLAVDLRQAVDRLHQVGQVLMAFTVPLGVDVRIAQPVIGTEVDDAHAAGQECRQRTHAGTVRQTAEGALDAASHQAVGIQRLAAQVEAPKQAGVQLADQGRIFLARRDRHDLGVRMAQQDFDEFQGRVAGAAQDGNLRHARKPRSAGVETL
jgi:hypothetical protein